VDCSRVELLPPQCECGALPDKLTAQKCCHLPLRGKLTALGGLSCFTLRCKLTAQKCCHLPLRGKLTALGGLSCFTLRCKLTAHLCGPNAVCYQSDWPSYAYRYTSGPGKHLNYIKLEGFSSGTSVLLIVALIITPFGLECFRTKLLGVLGRINDAVTVHRTCINPFNISTNIWFGRRFKERGRRGRSGNIITLQINLIAPPRNKNDE
jgi:hypothetical protein